eukprot:CAMPEP_0184343514 /NCGR_PEP_ID=MMETSP1089-20130417/12021_1 /TAXON_ID=38269 ORGANISM="Gloeochaete wittrockiana, Strain SAG46.84" /NCGR_SAMPLE_ID=MMETSP1089 /ASSEMBLY_ACC=CAM_ASM_000445 /LENGTH=99 /DNA_ID=CAMNT_0026672829 /DNA_START=73 /DNA_END=372 /DNA_ORIENTATION=+
MGKKLLEQFLGKGEAEETVTAMATWSASWEAWSKSFSDFHAEEEESSSGEELLGREEEEERRGEGSDLPRRFCSLFFRFWREFQRATSSFWVISASLRE